MYQAFLHIHSGLRWIILILIITAIFNAIGGKKRNSYEKKDKLINLFAMVSMHTQLLIGLVLYFISPRVSFASGWMKDAATRFYGMEHFLMMVIAIVLLTIGRKKAENAPEIIKKHKTIITWYAIALILIFAAIPWPFRTALGGQWF